MRQQLASGPFLLAGVIVTGLVKRLGEIVAMIATVKCISWIFKPDSVPPALTAILQLDPHGAAFHTILLTVPACLVVASTLGGLLFEKFLTLMSTRCSDRIAMDDLQSRMQVLADAHLETRTQMVDDVVLQFAVTQAKLVKIQRTFTTLLVSTTALLMAIAIGSAIQPVVTAAIAVAGVLLLVFVIWTRHETGQAIKTGSLERKIRGINRRRELREMLAASRLDGQGQQEVLALIKSQHRDVLADYSGRDRQQRAPHILLDVAQAGLLLLLMLSLLFIPRDEVHPQHVAMLMILALVMRFAMAQIRAMSRAAIQLSNDYAMLVGLRLKQPKFERWPTQMPDLDDPDRESL